MDTGKNLVIETKLSFIFVLNMVNYSYYEINDIVSELGGLFSIIGTVLSPLAISGMVQFMQKIVNFILKSYKKKYVSIKIKEAVEEAS